MMSPGTYLQKRRVAAGLSIIDVAMKVGTSPRLGEIDKVAWIGRVEADVAALSPDVIAALADAFPISLGLLQQLIDLRSFGPRTVDLPRLCATCACSEFDACLDQGTGETCAWASKDRCTSCAPVKEPVR